MSDSASLDTEQSVQHSFTKSSLFKGLAVAGLVVVAHGKLTGLPDREARPPARADVHFESVALDPTAFGPLKLVGAWRVTSPEPRMGGVSALAVDHGAFVALTDSGVVIRLPKPARSAHALFMDLPSGPGRAIYKAGRDSESLARDWAGRGWWVGFENRHSAFLFDPGFTRVLRRVGLGGFGWRSNLGAEGILSTRAGLLIFPEQGDALGTTVLSGNTQRPLANRFGRLSDATILPDGRVIVLARNYSPAGFTARLLCLDQEKKRLLPFARLGLGRLDNPEAIAAELLPGGNLRLWVMTDNDYRRRVPTLLLALDFRNSRPATVTPRQPRPSWRSRA
jgi:hypothetical protein